jgi:hypothetical protein
VLLTPRAGLLGARYVGIAALRTLFDGDPLLYVSDHETARRALLARERWPRFVGLLERFGGAARWRFLVKLGYEVDGADDASQREHLWFDVHAHDAGRVDATLLNAPCGIARLREGARGWHALERMSDWTVLCPVGQFDPESVLALERHLAEDVRGRPVG